MLIGKLDSCYNICNTYPLVFLDHADKAFENAVDLRVTVIDDRLMYESAQFIGHSSLEDLFDRIKLLVLINAGVSHHGVKLRIGFEYIDKAEHFRIQFVNPVFFNSELEQGVRISFCD